MRGAFLARFLLLSLTLAARGQPSGTAPASPTQDEQTLRAASLATDGAALVEFFRSRTLTEADREQIQALVRQLGDRSFRVREKASAELIRFGPRAIPLLRPALTDPDREVTRRAEQCLTQLQSPQGKGARVPESALAEAAVRLLAARDPARTAEVLLGYAPFCEHDTVADEIEGTLVRLLQTARKGEAELAKALKDGVASRRALAGVVLARSGGKEHRAEVLRLLKDPEPNVRLRVGLTAVHLREKEAVPVLIDLLPLIPPEQLWTVDDLLRGLAGEKAPEVQLSADPASRKKGREAWAGWWAAHGSRVDLGNLETVNVLRGYTLIVTPDLGRVVELDRDGKPRWQIDRLQSPFFAQVLPGDRVLIAEYSGTVTERNLKGEVLWQVSVPRAMQCQRLPGGDTFIINPDAMMIVDRQGKETWRQNANRTGQLFLAARKLRNGQIVAIYSDGYCVRLDASGKELHGFATGRVSNNCLDVLPNGNILVARWFDGKVTEYTPRGQVLNELSCSSPFAAFRMPNGNTLVADYDGAQVVEYSRTGKVVQQYRAESPNHRPWFTSRR